MQLTLLSNTDNPNSLVYDVFISHSGHDNFDFCASLYDALHNVGISTFLDEYDLVPGILVQTTIQNALKGAHYVLPILSWGYADSRGCLDELVLMMRAPEKVLPVFLDRAFQQPNDVLLTRLAGCAAP